MLRGNRTAKNQFTILNLDQVGRNAFGEHTGKRKNKKEKMRKKEGNK